MRAVQVQLRENTYLLEQVAHLDLHLLDHAARVRDVRGRVLEREVLLRLARHAPTERDLALALSVAPARVRLVAAEALRREGVLLGCARTGGAVDHLEHDGGGELVVRLPPPLGRFKDVDGVPRTGWLAGRRCIQRYEQR